MNILLGIGGSGPTKRIPSKIFLSVIEKISKVKKCKFKDICKDKTQNILKVRLRVFKAGVLICGQVCGVD